jgi:ketosteroid isomerase-like protein
MGGMLDREDAERWSEAWVEAWNSHDLDAILDHYAEDVVFTSPFAVELAGRADGTLHGKEQVRLYFARALAALPDLHFGRPRAVLGASSITLLYRSVRNLDAAETMVLDEDGKVVRVYAHYAPGS